jgi:hypothetical protein
MKILRMTFDIEYNNRLDPEDLKQLAEDIHDDLHYDPGPLDGVLKDHFTVKCEMLEVEEKGT